MGNGYQTADEKLFLASIRFWILALCSTAGYVIVRMCKRARQKV